MGSKNRLPRLRVIFQLPTRCVAPPWPEIRPNETRHQLAPSPSCPSSEAQLKINRAPDYIAAGHPAAWAGDTYVMGWCQGQRQGVAARHRQTGSVNNAAECYALFATGRRKTMTRHLRRDLMMKPPQKARLRYAASFPLNFSSSL